MENTKVMRLNTCNKTPIKIDGSSLEEVMSFTYLGSVVGNAGGSDFGIMSRINKARGTFNMLKKVWSSRSISPKTKLRIFNSNVQTVLL